MSSKKSQTKAGAPPKRRGQQMGDARSQQDKSLTAKHETMALRGRRKTASKFYGDESSQQVGSDGEAPRDNTPSLPAAIPTNQPIGQSGGEKEFKQRQAKKSRK